MLFLAIVLLYIGVTNAMTEAYSSKEQYCTDPRTMKKHAVNSEWADAYSCTRHRCQPGGRNLAIYTVGCKRVEAPESAIECEEVVEDTNMQFPFCCTRLRCLVVVRGEVWTRVLGQPWESLPAAPWSHMYKMKRPPPADGFLKKPDTKGPVYELLKDNNQEKFRSRKPESDSEDELALRAVPSPDIVIALATASDEKKSKDFSERASNKKNVQPKQEQDETEPKDNDIEEITVATTEKTRESNERYFPNTKTTKVTPFRADDSPGDIKWFENEDTYEPPQLPNDPRHDEEENKPDKLQALVDAIGTKMRDIEHVVQRMNDKADPEQNRFNEHNRRNKYIRVADITTDVPLFVRDKNGYFSDASNLLRRHGNAREPSTYMAPVDTHHHSSIIPVPGSSEKQRKHSHKHKVHFRRKHKKLDKKKKFNKVVRSDEVDNTIEDSKIIVK